MDQYHLIPSSNASIYWLLYHGINGLPIVAADFFPALLRLRIAERLFFSELILLTVLFVPAGYYLIWELPQEAFYHNPGIAALITLAVLMAPAVAILVARQQAPSTVMSGDVSNGNNKAAFQKLRQAGGFKYDALLHTVFVGFVISMIFGHAPIIFPAILRLPIRYTPAFYIHLALLHLPLMIRIAGDLMSSLPLRMWGGLLNGIAILIFLMITAYSIAASKKGNVVPTTTSI